MDLIDYFDRQLLGYLRAHPDMLFRDAARALGAHPKAHVAGVSFYGTPGNFSSD